MNRWDDGVEFGYQLRPRAFETMANYVLWRTAFRHTWHRINQSQLKDGLVHICSPDIPPIFRSDRSIISIHDNPLVSLDTDLYSVPPSYRLVVRKNLHAYQRYGGTIVQSGYVKQGLEDWGYEGLITVIPPALHPAFRRLQASKNESRQLLGLPIDKRLVLSISTMTKRKNLSGVRQTMSHLPSNYALVRVGPPLGSSVHFQNVDDEMLNLIYNSCDVLLFPSIEEGFGVPVIEAFAAGLPVVASSIPSISEVAAGAAQLLPPDDSRGLANAIIDVTSSPDDSICRGLERSKSFTPEVIAPRLAHLYSGTGLATAALY